MDRPEPGLIKWSPTASHDRFMHVNLQHRVVQVYEPTGHAQRGRFDYKKLSKHDDVPPLTTYDWSPTIPGLVAVGTQVGVVNLLRIDDDSNAYLELSLKVSRTCQAVAFSTSNLLAVGLDRVRSDQGLHIWDVNRLTGLQSHVPSGFPTDITTFVEPIERREPSVSISSIKFFEDNPNTLVVGVKGQGVRIHDLRDPSYSVISFQTRCNNNIAIDYADQNYFASSALDQPGVMVWDRRAVSRDVASPSYLDAIDIDDVPWGGALRLERAMNPDSDQAMSDSKNSFIRSLRYCRDHRGMLAILSRNGQLKVLSTKAEHTAPDMETEGSPELLTVRMSNEMDTHYSDSTRKNDRIVSFDWITLDSPVLRPRLLALRANGAFDILEVPSSTASYPYKLIPWQAPHRGLEEGGPYQSALDLEQSQVSEVLGQVAIEDYLSDIPIFGPDKADLAEVIQKCLRSQPQQNSTVVDEQAVSAALPKTFTAATTIAQKLQALRLYAEQRIHESDAKQQDRLRKSESSATIKGMADSSNILPTSRQLHERLLNMTLDTKGFPKEAKMVLDHIMLFRAKEKYLFDFRVNQSIVADDPWLRGLWTWIYGAEEAVADGGMMSHPLDLGYMGVASLWMNDLGSKRSSRLSDGSSTTPDISTWERSINAICKKRGIPRFDGVETRKPHHRRLCLDICGWGRWDGDNYIDLAQLPGAVRLTTHHTMATAQALFRGDTKQAVRILKEASTEFPELLFVSLALQLTGKGGSDVAKEQLDFDDKVASKTDPFLKAISTFIATGDWSRIANQKSLPLRDRVSIAVRNFDDRQLSKWLDKEVQEAIDTGDIEGILLTGITDKMVDILAKYIEKFHDLQTATLIMSICAPRFIDDHRCTAWRNAYRAYLQRHRAFFQRTKFEVESTKKSKRDGRPTIKPPFRQIALRCVYCDAETRLATAAPSSAGGGGGGGGQLASSSDKDAQLANKMALAGVSCPNCKRHLPRCVVCLEIVGMPRSNVPENADGGGDGAGQGGGLAARFPTFCLKCEHVLHLDHARQWFARHGECPVPECRCKCNFRANPELSYR